MSAFVRTLATPVFAALFLFSGVALAGQVEVQWLGHATTRITTAGGKSIVKRPSIVRASGLSNTRWSSVNAIGSRTTARALMDYCFGERGIRRLTCGHFVDNMASARVITKLGCRRKQDIIIRYSGVFDLGCSSEIL